MNRRAADRAVASGKPLDPVARLAGREAELARIRDLLAAARAGGGAVLRIDGQPGIGKTALLAAAADLADGFRCLWAHGVESETVLGHAALLELLTPLRDRLGDIPAGQARALATALGWEAPGPPADRFLVGAATMSLLAAGATAAPVLVLVDDVQWLDDESVAALLFAAGRLGRDPVAFLVAVRSGAPLPPPLRSWPAVEPGGLSPATAATVLGDLPAGVVTRLVEVTDGVPLALLDVAPRLTPAQRVGAAPLPDPLPVGPRLVDGYLDVLGTLSPDAWRTVLVAAVAPPSALGPGLTALQQDGVDVSRTVDEAEERGVLVRESGGLRFRHPLLRTAVLRRATPAERRAAHRTLARALGGNDARAERVWHRALGADGADDDLAAELAAAAEDTRAQWGPATASAALERAALLTGRPERAAGWLAAATEAAFLAGDASRARQLGERVLTGPAGPAARSRVLFSLGVLEQYAGSVPRAVDLLAAAADEATGQRSVQVLGELALARFRLGDLAGIAECARGIEERADRTDPGQRLLADFTGGVAQLLLGDDEGGRARLGDVVTGATPALLRSDPRHLLLVALASGFLGDTRPALALGAGPVDDVRARGAVGILVPVLALRAAGRAMTGDHAGAFADAGEAAELGEQLGYAADTAVALEMVAWQSAARGRHEDAERALDRARALTDRAGTTGVAAHQALTAAFCALSRGDLHGVVAILEARLDVDGGVGAMGEPLGVAPLLVEAYAGLGRRADAGALARRYADGVSPAPLDVALAERCRAVAADDDEAAEAAFARSLAAHEQAGDPFETARTRLLSGARLRRGGRRVAARSALTAAAESFEAMELTAWYRRAAGELAATGATARPRRPLATEPLTSQETRVALLVARGCSNKEVAAALFLSPKTVEHHVGSVFRKRGLRSRTELAAAFAAAAASATGTAEG